MGLVTVQEKITNGEGKTYKLKILEVRLRDKIEILNSKILLERYIIEKSPEFEKEELIKRGIKNMSFKSILKNNKINHF